ncbi:hypothetical protein QYS49_05495 [Marivirga salinae]|uniref:Uncharacterized protein n=1 Tax=Marivirga salinarum TaxID=3059078 RepID=A0AA49JBU4_9BACT|nr:hypothetical protein [Marivirga sp. BDSF4-3]WKK76736.2 hypothetical protein QYS49_05495 [Marivirga sp. BDSF4-3]
MKNLLTLITILLLATSNLNAQKEATTNEGEKVLLYEDGTWDYVDTKSESELSESTNSDDCSQYVSVEVDKMTGDKSYAGKELLIVSKDGGKNGFGFYLLKSDRGSIIISAQVVGASSCIDDDDKMNVLFRDGTRLELVNDAKFNCKGNYTQYFLGVFGKKKQLEMFINKPIETMRIWTNDGYVEEDFTPEQSNTLMNTISCLVNS